MDFATFVAAATHDMKNSVSVIAAYLEDALVQGGTGEEPSPADSRRLMQQALYEAQRVNGHLVQLMATYKIERGIYPFDPEEVDLAEFCAEAVQRVTPLSRTKGLDLQSRIEAEVSSWFFDRELVLSVVVQAMFNAARYTRSRICLELRVVDNMLQFAIDDDGAGFPASMLEQDYPPQGIDSRTGSTGLGLHFAREVARLHRHHGRQGQTRLQNIEGGGGRFAVSLP